MLKERSELNSRIAKNLFPFSKHQALQKTLQNQFRIKLRKDSQKKEKTRAGLVEKITNIQGKVYEIIIEPSN
jgi:hypothetical protein